MKPNKNFDKDLKLRIIKFFEDNPVSLDSPRGIAAWIGEDIDLVKNALEDLEKKKIVISHKTNFVTGYSLTRDENILKKIKNNRRKK